MKITDTRVLLPDIKALGHGRIKIRHRSLVTLKVGSLEIDIRDLEQLVCEEQVCALGHLLLEIIKKGGPIPLSELKKYTHTQNNEFSIIRDKREDFAGVRYLDLISVLNRTPGLVIEKSGDRGR